MKRFCILLFLLLAPVLWLRSETQLFRLFDVESGLPESQVRDVSQLPDGRIFILTVGLVNIYDGAEFKTFHYKPDESAPVDRAGFHENYIDKQGLLWIKRLNSFQILDLKREKFIEHPGIYVEKEFGIPEKISNFFIDQTGAFWFFTQKSNLYRCTVKGGTPELVPLPHLAGSKIFAATSFQGNAYVFTSEGKIFSFEGKSLQLLHTDDYLTSYFLKPPSEPISKVHVSNGSFYIICSIENGESGFLEWNPVRQSWKKLYASHRIFTSMDICSDGQIILGGEDGLFYFTSAGKLIRKQSSFQTEEGRTLTDKVVSIFSDQQQGLWIAFNNYGLIYYNYSRIRFNRISNSEDLAPGWKGTNVTALLPWNEQELLVGTMNGLFLYNRQDRLIRVFDPLLSGVFVLTLSRAEDGSVWAGTIDSSCYRIQDGNIKKYDIITEQGVEYGEKNIRGVNEYPGLGYWLFSRSLGAGRFDPETERYFPLVNTHPELKHVGMVTHAIPWDTHSLLFATQSGLFIYDVYNDKVSFPGEGDEKEFFDHSSRKYNCVMRDSRGWIWLGTQDGLNLYLPKEKKAFSYYMEDGLVNNSIRSVVEDKEGGIWVATSNGVSHFVLSGNVNHPVHYIRNFDSRSGLLRGEYLERASCLFADGTIYLGGLNGLSEMLPMKLNGSHEEFTPMFSSLKVQGKEVQVGDPKNKILIQSISTTRKIELSYKQNNLSLDFTTQNFANPEQTHYRYRLEGSSNREWTELKSVNGKGTVSFTSLSPGKYSLVVYAAVNNRQWGKQPAVMELVIHPPFYLSTFSIVVYVLLIVGLIVYLWLSTVRRKERQLRVRQKREKQKQEEKLNQLKYRFITNVSHELRTPLTLIVTPLEHLLHTVADGPVKKQLKVISQGAEELRGMINQLLDFRRIEMKGEKLTPTYNDISAYLQSVHSFFLQLAQERKVVFNLNRQHLTLNIWYDKEKMQKILNNLLSNAFKFTEEGGIIDLRQSVGTMPGKESREAIRIEVCDTGCGISPEDIPHIFERFYQGYNQGSTPGSGIGLHLTMEYVKMHEGLIEVKSEIGKGSCFVVWIPIKNYEEESLLKEKKATVLPSSSSGNSEETQLPEDVTPAEAETAEEKATETRLRILLADDNESLLRFVADLLVMEYDVITATDGLTAQELALTELPDLIVSDVMMPGIDGFELCRRLRNDIRTSHIPIILLTAKGSDEDQISGYKSGADAYVSKPFNYEILRLRIHRLLELLDKRKKEFRQSVKIDPEKITGSKLDEGLIAKAVEMVMKNLDNSEYTVEQFSKDMNMDRTGLYRKLLSLVGLTPVIFIRSIRMKEAAKLLRETSDSVSEVAYRVGYSTPRYFSKHFTQEFGIHPSDYAK